MSGEAELTRFMLEMLKEAVTGYMNIKSGAKLELEKLKNELRLLEAFIKDSAKRSEKKEVFKEKERQIRELVYDVEDIIETCLAKKAAAKTKSFMKRQVKKMSISLEKEVKSLREDRVLPVIRDITNEFGRITVDDRSTVINPQVQVKKAETVAPPSVTVFAGQSSSQSDSHQEDKVVNFVDQGAIIDYLMEEKEGLDVISITGMAGIGKTTLARRVLHDPNVVSKFQFRIWIHVSQKFNSREVFLDILKILAPQAKSNPSVDELISTVRGCLANKKFLLVLDDIWKVDDWKEIEKILPKNNIEGKVLITSREGVVARFACTFGRIPHEMNQLGPEKSWELLKLKVFGPIKKCPPELEHIGKAIAGKCGGSPLIIGVIGGILKDHIMQKKSSPAIKTEWADLYKNVGNNLITGKDQSISDAVKLSYSRLSDELRVCFLYTGLFPDNHEISASTLTRLWIAEGFIRPEEGKSLEETAVKFLNELISMNLLMVERKNLDQVKSCRVHDTIREFCKAKGAAENLFTVVKQGPAPSASEVENFRRLCLHSDASESILAARRLRSYICFFKSDQKQIPDAFKLLRVLSCKSLKLKEFPKVAKLILLKHITISIDHLEALPEEIYYLVNLQTLIIETNSRSIHMKDNIWKLAQLRHIKTRAAIFLVEDKKSKIEPHENIQTISRLSPESCTTTLSHRAPNLKTLGIRGKLANLFDTLSLEKFPHLEKLELVNDDVEDSPLQRLPQRDCFPQMLNKLTLSKTYLKWDTHMPMLAAINTLQLLKLKDNAFQGFFWNAMDVGFRSLQFLLVEETDLVIWEASPTQFPSLRWLSLKKCEKLQKIPGELASAENLEKLELERVKTSAVESAKEIKLLKQQQPNQFGVVFKLIVDQVKK